MACPIHGIHSLSSHGTSWLTQSWGPEVEQGRDGVLLRLGITTPKERNQSRKELDSPTNARSLSFAVIADRRRLL
ncbi:hypothetical protein L484_000680 [Morus notabilis]|uniref:Uncharacterized protein n=1 Tax=Morus notabilis TaxID=981085 RepID=W9QZV1_9ROSA|nr:hypothetical protein L484_000680 [Morus notabilis]